MYPTGRILCAHEDGWLERASRPMSFYSLQLRLYLEHEEMKALKCLPEVSLMICVSCDRERETERDFEAAKRLILVLAKCSGALLLPTRPLLIGEAFDESFKPSFFTDPMPAVAGELGAYFLANTPGLVGGLANGAELIEWPLLCGRADEAEAVAVFVFVNVMVHVNSSPAK